MIREGIRLLSVKALVGLVSYLWADVSCGIGSLAEIFFGI